RGIRRVAARPRPRRADPRRTLRSRAAAHPDRRSPPARGRRRPRRRGDRHHRRAAPAAARPPASPRRRLPRPEPDLTPMPLRHALAVSLALLLLAACQRDDAHPAAGSATATPGPRADAVDVEDGGGKQAPDTAAPAGAASSEEF